MDVEFELDPSAGEVAERLQELQESVADEIEAAAEEIALRIIADARREVNVDTGRLRASIDFETERKGEYKVRLEVGSNVEYAIYQEIDSPFIRPAIEQNRETINQIIEEAVANKVAENSAS